MKSYIVSLAPWIAILLGLGCISFFEQLKMDASMSRLVVIHFESASMAATEAGSYRVCR